MTKSGPCSGSTGDTRDTVRKTYCDELYHDIEVTWSHGPALPHTR